MNICIATDSYPPHNSGIATHNAYLVKLLQEGGHSIVVLTVDMNDRKSKDIIIQQDGVTIVMLKKSYQEQYRYFSRFIKTGTKEAVVWLSLGMSTRKWLLDNNTTYKFDVIEFSDYGGFGCFLIDKTLAPALAMCHGMLTQLEKKEFYNQDENLSIIRFLETSAIRNADAVICHSKSNAKDIEQEFGVQTEYVTAPWINDQVSSQAKTTNEFLIASRLQVCKGAIVMAEVMLTLQKDYPEIKLTWIGDNTYTAPGGYIVSKYIKEKYPSIWNKTFIWKDSMPRKQMMETLESADTIIIPSTWETFNYVALEAANRRKSVIMTKQAGFSSVLDADHNFILTDASDINSIRDAMIRLHQDKDYSKKLGNNFYVAAQGVFTKDAFLHDRNEAYELAIERRKLKTPVNPLEGLLIPLKA